MVIQTWNDAIFMNKENTMKPVVRYILLVSVLLCLFGGGAQSVKVNIPLWLTGSPNIGFEYTLTRQLTVNAEGHGYRTCLKRTRRFSAC